MKTLLAIVGAFTLICLLCKSVPAYGPDHAQMTVDNGVVTVCTHAYLISLHPDLLETEINPPNAGTLLGFYDQEKDICYVVVKDVVSTVRSGLTDEQVFTAIHEHAHQEDAALGARGLSHRWIWLALNKPSDLTHEDINYIVFQRLMAGER